jgi:hypothetical protein
MRVHRIALTLLFAIPCICIAQVKLEKAGALTDAAAPAAVRDALEDAGYRVLRADGTPRCEIWLRKSLPAASGKAVQGANYPELAEAEFVGVISFPSGGKDYRGQPIKAGIYGLRYELLPNDGNHMGVAPARDFLLLTPLAADPDPSAHYTYEQLMVLSRRAAGSNHPAVFSMVEPEGTLPGAYTSGEGYEVFAAKLKLAAGRELPFALVVKGQAEQ